MRKRITLLFLALCASVVFSASVKVEAYNGLIAFKDVEANVQTAPVSLNDVSGTVIVQARNGPIKLSDASGNISVDTLTWTGHSIAPGGTLEFKQLKITVLETTVDSRAATPHDIVRIRLDEGGATEVRTARQGDSFNWHGYHVAVAAIHGAGDLGGGRVVLGVAMVASLPQCIGKPIGKDSPWPCR